MLEAEADARPGVGEAGQDSEDDHSDERLGHGPRMGEIGGRPHRYHAARHDQAERNEKDDEQPHRLVPRVERLRPPVALAEAPADEAQLGDA